MRCRTNWGWIYSKKITLRMLSKLRQKPSWSQGLAQPLKEVKGSSRKVHCHGLLSHSSRTFQLFFSTKEQKIEMHTLFQNNTFTYNSGTYSPSTQTYETPQHSTDSLSSLLDCNAALVQWQEKHSLSGYWHTAGRRTKQIEGLLYLSSLASIIDKVRLWWKYYC